MKKVLKKLLAYILIACELFQVTGVYALTKDESIYVRLEEDGKVNNAIASEHLYNFSDKKVLDKTNLCDIKNLNDNSKFSQNDNKLIWETSGSDIYYQGTYKKDLPISIEVKYYLNGKEQKVDNILGKKGNIKIVLNYKNNYKKKYNINGALEDIYVPYMIITTTILNNADNKNIKVTNGRVVDNGVSQVVIALSSPGIDESLNINDLKSMNKVEISYDTDNFELNPIYSVATTDVFEDSNFNVFSEVNSLYNNINELQSNMDKIVDASKKLSDGSDAVNAGIAELNNNVKTLVSKYNYYRNQDIEELKRELNQIVDENIDDIISSFKLEEEISSVLKEHKKDIAKATIKNTQIVVEERIEDVVNNINVNQISEQVLQNELNNLLSNNNELDNMIKSLKESINNHLNTIITEELSSINNDISNSITKEDIETIANEYGVSYEQAEGIANATLGKVKEKVNSESIINSVITKINEDNYTNSLVKEYINNLNNKIKNSLNDKEFLKQYEEELKTKITEKIKEKLASNDSYNTEFVESYIDSIVDEIIDKTVNELGSKYTKEVVKKTIDEQITKENIESKLGERLNNLDGAINNLSTGMEKLNNGSSLVANGNKELFKGLEQYNKLGINKISNIVNGKVKSTQKRIESLIDSSNEYGLLDEKNDDVSGKSKMIFMIDSKTLTDNKTNESINKVDKSQKTLWDKIKGLFN